MKRILSVLLAVLMLTSLGETASAAADTEADSWKALGCGFEMQIPDSFRNAKGYITFCDLGEGVNPGSGIVSASATYAPIPGEEYRALMAEEEAAYENGNMEKLFEISDKLGQVQWSLFTLYGINRGRGEKELRAFLAEQNLDPAYYDGNEEVLAAVKKIYENMHFTEIGEKDGFRYYISSYAAEDYDKLFGLTGIEEIDPVALNEFKTLVKQNGELKDNVRLTGGAVVADVAEAGTKLAFETTDLDGKTVKSNALFSGHKFTMINMWATWCGPCKDELPAIAKMAEDFEKQGCQIIGICLDAEDEETMALGREILEDAGVDYINLVPFAEREELLPNEVYPTTYFVDENGVVMDEVIAGAMLSRYMQILEKLLSR